MTQRYKQNGTDGFTLLEMVMYVAILSLTLVSVIAAISGVMRAYSSTQAQTRIGRAATFSLSRMTHEIRLADAADTLQSSFGSHPGILALTSSAPARTVRFYVENGTLKFDENGAYAGDLTPEHVFVNSFVAHHLQSDASDAIRMQMTLDSATRNGTTSETFYMTAVMRGSYAQ
ncbi:MAG: hypothetical protein AMXMBFR44_0610 [Candidatus Campbellbacteria bacterium]